jgi:hypothetical protein
MATWARCFSLKKPTRHVRAQRCQPARTSRVVANKERESERERYGWGGGGNTRISAEGIGKSGRLAES